MPRSSGRRLGVCLVLAALLSACGGSYTAVYIVRHAEKVAKAGRNPPLTKVGEARAQALAARLEHANIRAVYSTDTTRTKSTAQPLADRLGLTVQTYASTDEVAARIGAGFVDGGVLIVGHSNTIHALVTALGAKLPPSAPGEVGHLDYDNLFYVLLTGEGPVALHSTFGVTARGEAPSPR